MRPSFRFGVFCIFAGLALMLAGCGRKSGYSAFYLSTPVEVVSPLPARQAADVLPEPLFLEAAPSMDLESSVTEALLALPLQVRDHRKHYLTTIALMYLPLNKQFNEGPGGAIKYAYRPSPSFEINLEASLLTTEGDEIRGGAGKIDAFPILAGVRYIQTYPETVQIYVGLGAGWVIVDDQNVEVALSPLLPSIRTPITMDDAFGAYVCMGAGYPFLFSDAVFELEYRFLFAEADVNEFSMDAELSGSQIRVTMGWSF